MNISIDEMKECIQEWFEQANSPVELAMIYADCKMELDKQLICRMSFFYEKD